MRPDGGEARRITDAREGVADYALSDDGQWIAFKSGKAGEQQLYRLPVKDLDAPPRQLTKHPTGIETWRWSPDGRRIYFTAPDTADADDKARREKKFTVNIRNAETPLESLWAVELGASDDGKDQPATRRLTEDSSYSIGSFTISGDGKWIAFQGGSAKRYERNITSAGLYGDAYLLETAQRHDRAAHEERRGGGEHAAVLPRQPAGSRSRRRMTPSSTA